MLLYFREAEEVVVMAVAEEQGRNNWALIWLKKKRSQKGHC